MNIGRRSMLAGVAGALAGCDTDEAVAGSFVGANHARGHLVRDAQTLPAPRTTRRTHVVIAGAGIAGLAAARALRQRGIDDFVVLDLEDEAGGNSRGGELGGMACPWGAHYLPVPGDAARDVQDLLEELGLRRRVAGRWVYDERHLCHAPQERLYFRGRWQEGLLPLHDVSGATLEQYRRFAARIEQERREASFRIPMAGLAPGRAYAAHARLDALTFQAWLQRERLDDEHLRWYLDYCCRDEYGAGLSVVSAWAGVHYFAARHGFHPPGAEEGERDTLLTWPEGNAFLARSLAQPLGERLRARQVVLRVAEGRHAVEVDVYNAAQDRLERWQAARCIVALPAFVAARVHEGEQRDFLRRKASHVRYAPWLVANLHLRGPLRERAGAAPAWDNVIYGASSLGYVRATHQSLSPVPGPTVLTWYLAPGEADRKQLLERPWEGWRDHILGELALPHPELRRQLRRIDIARYGHAMAIPVPGALAHSGVPPRTPRLSFAHSDWAGYSIFEEAFTLGHAAGRALA